MPRRKSIHFVSLGCPKNRVDTEVMLGVAEQAGYRHTDDATSAQVIVVNTCGFIGPAKQESIETILELAEHKRQGACRKLIVTGCLSQRYSEDLAAGMPEVDHFLGSSDMPRLGIVLRGEAPRLFVGNPADWVVSASDPRTLSTRGASAYVKLAEGCNRKCSFCVIPNLRGKQRSRPVHDIVTEVERLASAGVREVNLISQDTVAYGRDLADPTTLADAVQQIAEVPGIAWVRLHYLYPETLTAQLVELIGHHPRVLPYVDMPLQHAADAMLRRMRRGHGGKRLYALVERLRKQVPGLVIRSAFIVGHPGETEEEFEELRRFVAFAELDRVGVFRYSDEPESHSHHLAGHVLARVAERRARKLMSLQRRISRRRMKQLVGHELEVLVEQPSEEHELVMTGRYYGQAPEIDGCVYLSGADVAPGELRRVQVVEATDYDLLGEVVDEAPRQPITRRTTTPLAHRSSDGRRVKLRTVG
jgi:ribosomal protein S12 methylthiotransferase